jgi:hypothetical protein
MQSGYEVRAASPRSRSVDRWLGAARIGRIRKADPVRMPASSNSWAAGPRRPCHARARPGRVDARRADRASSTVTPIGMETAGECGSIWSGRGGPGACRARLPVRASARAISRKRPSGIPGRVPGRSTTCSPSARRAAWSSSTSRSAMSTAIDTPIARRQSHHPRRPRWPHPSAPPSPTDPCHRPSGLAPRSAHTPPPSGYATASPTRSGCPPPLPGVPSCRRAGAGFVSPEMPSFRLRPMQAVQARPR